MKRSSSQNPDSSNLLLVLYSGILICALLLIISLLSQPFSYGSKLVQPVLAVAGQYIIASFVALMSVWIAIRIKHNHKRLIQIVIVLAVGMRLIQLFSPPILEVDLYRYLWDGQVINEGISPYRYSPQQALSTAGHNGDLTLQTVQALSAKSESIHTIVSRIHFEEYTTIYPPVSQAMFAITTWLIPDDAPVNTHLLSIKSVLVLFDIGTMLFVLGLLLQTRTHPGWLIVYAWNPLVLKEIANSGHLDSIAVFFTAAACYGMLSLLKSRTVEVPDTNKNGWTATAITALFLGLGTGAKLYPVILLPLFLVVAMKKNWRQGFLLGFIYLIITAALLWPMLRQPTALKNSSDIDNKPAAASVELNSKAGLTGFLQGWRMNDLIFNFVYENSRPNSKRTLNQPWYVVTSNTWRQNLNQWMINKSISKNPPFTTARIVCLACFSLFYLWLLWIVIKRESTGTNFLASAFAVIAIFFFLQPTQNPWYWVWAMPLVCFARNRAWLFVSAFLFCYYLRFWFKQLPGEFPCLGQTYTGSGLFDHVIVWVEYGLLVPIFIWFGVAQNRQRRIAKPMKQATPRDDER